MIANAVSENKEVLSVEEIRLLAEIGFMAARARHVTGARQIFEGLSVLRPGQAFVHLGMALASLGAGDPDGAAAMLRDKALRECPGADDLTVFLAIALKEAQRGDESRRVLQDMLAQPAAASPARRLAANLLAGQPGGLPAPLRVPDVKRPLLRAV